MDNLNERIENGKFNLDLPPNERTVYNALRRLLGELYYTEIDQAFFFSLEREKQDLIGKAKVKLEKLKEK